MAVEVTQEIALFLHHLVITHYAEITATMILAWEWLITADQEIEFVWKARWSVGKALFLINRYYSLFVIIFNNIVTFYPGITDKLCVNFYRWQGANGVIYVLVSQGTIILRLYALYNLNKLVLVSVLFVCLVCVSTSLVILGIAFSHQHAQALSVGSYTFCVAPKTPMPLWAYYIPHLISESFLCAFALVWAFSNRWRGQPGASWRDMARLRFPQDNVTGGRRVQWIIDVIIRDQIVYYIVILITYLTSALTVAFAPYDLVQIPMNIGFSINSSVTCRMLFNLRGVLSQSQGQTDHVHIHGVGTNSTAPHFTPVRGPSTTNEFTLSTPSNADPAFALPSRTKRQGSYDDVFKPI